MLTQGHQQACMKPVPIDGCAGSLGVHTEAVTHLCETLVALRTMYGQWTIHLSGLDDMHAGRSDMLWETQALTLLDKWMRVSDDCITGFLCN